MSKKSFGNDDKWILVTLVGTVLAFLIAAITAFNHYPFDFLIGKIGYAFCVGIVWGLAALSLLSACNPEFRRNASVPDKIFALLGIFYPLLYSIGWNFYTEPFLLEHPLIRAYCALCIPAILFFIIRLLIKYFDNDYKD